MHVDGERKKGHKERKSHGTNQRFHNHQQAAMTIQTTLLSIILMTMMAPSAHAFSVVGTTTTRMPLSIETTRLYYRDSNDLPTTTNKDPSTTAVMDIAVEKQNDNKDLVMTTATRMDRVESNMVPVHVPKQPLPSPLLPKHSKRDIPSAHPIWWDAELQMGRVAMVVSILWMGQEIVKHL